MPSPLQQPRLQNGAAIEATSTFRLISTDNPNSHNPQDPVSNSDHDHESPLESASSQETWPTASALLARRRVVKEEAAENKSADDHSISRRIGATFDNNRISLRDVASGGVDAIAERMQNLPNQYLEDLKGQLRVILEGNGGVQQREEFMMLQRMVQTRFDLTAETLARSSHRVQLEILVAINTGIQAFLHRGVNLSQSSLIEVFTYKRCRNIACHNPIPADDCSCDVCSTRRGFCNFCMCVLCSKFDFEVNTCRWIGCDLCSHWTHSDCAIREGHIFMGVSRTELGGSSRREMLFRCKACNRTSELLGWVKDVFSNCAENWTAEDLVRELDYVCRIFRGSEDVNGSKLFWKCEDLIEKLRNGLIAESVACKMILHFFQEVEMQSPLVKDLHHPKKESGLELNLIDPQEACNRIAEVVQEAVGKMEMVADMKMRLYKKALAAVEVCDQQLEEKAREVDALKMEKQRKKQQVEELERIVRLKQAEADMFQLKANEAKREAERLQKIILNNRSDRSPEEDYTSTYLKLRLEEAEAEKQFLFSKIKRQESSQASPGMRK